MPLTPPRQLSLFGVEAAEPGPADLAGLLAGPGQIERMGGTARVSVVVDAAWRVHVLVAELAARGLIPSWESHLPSATQKDEKMAVRTAYTTMLAPLAEVWLHPGCAPGRVGGKRPPVGFYLDGARLRLWVAAAGTNEPEGFLLRLGPSDEATWDPVGAALAALGVPGVLVSGSPAYKITGRRRLGRLAELVGERPVPAPPDAWP